jgi:predicted negative regulator of RcsB-dependent stress response
LDIIFVRYIIYKGDKMDNKQDIVDKEGKSLEERMFFLERFYNKNKGTIVSLVLLSIVGTSGYFGYQIYLDYNREIANKAFYNYTRGIETEKSLQIIKETEPKLLSLIEFSQAMTEGNVSEIEKFVGNANPVISDLATYQTASLNKDNNGLNNYSYREGAVYKDLAIISEAFALIQNGKVNEAHQRLNFIEDTSSLAKVKNILAHYGIVPEMERVYDASTDTYKKVEVVTDFE